MAKVKTVEFMVEYYRETYNGELEYKIVESYDDPERFNTGYDIYQVTTDDVSKIRVINEISGTEYTPDGLLKCNDGIYYVNLWKPVA